MPSIWLPTTSKRGLRNKAFPNPKESHWWSSLWYSVKYQFSLDSIKYQEIGLVLDIDSNSQAPLVIEY